MVHERTSIIIIYILFVHLVTKRNGFKKNIVSENVSIFNVLIGLNIKQSFKFIAWS